MIKKSSTENSSNNVRNVNYNGNCNNNNKNNTYGVVPVRVLTMQRKQERHYLMLPNEFSLFEIWFAYFLCRKRKRRTTNALKFEYNLEFNLLQLYYELNSGSYYPGQSTVFTIDYPKPREVWAALFKDRIVHHLLVKYLADFYEPRFIPDSYACIKGRGTLRASDKFITYLRRETNNWDKSTKKWIVKCDISNFFVSIDRRILWNIIKNDIHPECISFLGSKYIKQSIFYDPTNNPIVRCNSDFSIIPPHKSLYNTDKNHGLPIGNLTSQFYANIYLNVFDQYCKHILKLRSYVRYVDDFVFVVDSPDIGRELLYKIDTFLTTKLKLTLSMNKCHIIPIMEGVSFVGRVIKPFHVTPRKMVFDIATSTADFLAHREYSMSIAPVNSYIGLNVHNNAYKFRQKLCNMVARPTQIIHDKNFTKIYRIS